MTPEQQAANLRTAARLTATQLHIAWPQDDSWTQADLVAYDRALAAQILKYPDRFTPSTVAIAQSAKNAHLDPELEENTAATQLSQFSTAFGAEAVNTLGDFAAIGTGIRNTLQIAPWLLPVVAVIATGILLWSLREKTRA